MENKITTMERGMQRRTELLLGKDNLEKLQSARVLIFGIGGVGSWCAEGLLRSGVRNITIVDSDRVCVTNCNLQLLSLIHISEPTRRNQTSRMPSSA